MSIDIIQCSTTAISVPESTMLRCMKKDLPTFDSYPCFVAFYKTPKLFALMFLANLESFRIYGRLTFVQHAIIILEYHCRKVLIRCTVDWFGTPIPLKINYCFLLPVSL